MDESGSNIASSGLVKNRSKTSKVSHMKKTFDYGRNVIGQRVSVSQSESLILKMV
jgi:hypothetical protein